MNCGMYLSKNFLSAWIEFPASGHFPGCVYCLTNESISISAFCRVTLLSLQACVNPDCKVQIHYDAAHFLLKDFRTVHLKFAF